MEKRIKNSLLLISFLVCIFSFTTNASAKIKSGTYTVSPGVVDNTGGSRILDGYAWATGVTYWNFNGVSDKVYCVTPGAAAPKAGDTFNKYDLGSNQEAFDYICTKIKDLDDKEKDAILKLAAISTGISTAQGDSQAYTKYESRNDIKFTGKAGDGTVRQWLKEMKTAKSEGTKVSASQNGNIVTITTDGVNVNLSVDNGYTIKVDGTQVGSSTSLTTTSKKTYKITVVAPEGSSSSSTTLKISYDQGKAGTSVAKATAYKITQATKGIQKGISCDYSNASNNCDTGFNLSGDSCQKDIPISENKKEKTCDDIEVSEKHGSAGDGICDLDGNTIVEVKENKYSSDPSEDDLECIAKNSTNATEIVYGNGNEYCEVYCTENISMVLPGPDAKDKSQNADGSNKNLYINAGSFFTIEGEMKQTDNVTCYSKLDYNKYQGTIYNARNKIVEAYNEYAYKQALKSASSQKTDPETNITTCELTGSRSYNVLAIDTKTGNITKSTGTLISADCNISDTTINSLRSALYSAISTAETDIDAASKKWNECFESFDMNKIVKVMENDCNTEITFDFGDAECAPYELEGTTTASNITTASAKLTDGKVNIGICDYNSLINGGTNGCNKDDKHEFAKYISSSATLTTTYKFNNDFTINLKTGEVSCDAKTGEEYSEVYQGFPIKTTAIQGKYAYHYTYAGVGHNLESGICEAGRFDRKIKENSFGCYFDVNSCKECDVVCVGDGCVGGSDECDKECQTACVGGGCVFDGNGGFMPTYKTISLNNEFAYNAMSQDKTTMVALASNGVSSTANQAGKFSNWETPKGEETSDEILKNGETIYANEPEYSVTLTPSDIADIKKYNESEVSYSKTELNCTNYKNYGICTSNFIHDTFEKLFTINSTGETTYNGVGFTSYDQSKMTEFVGPAWK